MAKALHDLIALCLPQDSWRITLMREWPTLLGPLSNRVSIEAITDATLVLGVSDSCLMQELYLLSPLIVTTVQKSIGNSHIKQVRLKRSEIVTHQKSYTSSQRSSVKKAVSLTRSEAHALESINDAELKEALRMYCIRCHQEREI